MVVNSMQYFGVLIDRETNFERGPHMVKRESEDQISCLPSEMDMGDSINLLLQLDLQIHTDLKLNLIDSEGNNLLTDEQKLLPEVHSLRFECYLSSTELTYSNLFGLIKTAVWEFITRETKMEF